MRRQAVIARINMIERLMKSGGKWIEEFIGHRLSENETFSSSKIIQSESKNLRMKMELLSTP